MPARPERESFLTADLGNTFLKLARWERREGGPAHVEERVRLTVGADLEARLRSWLAVQPPPCGASLCSVVDPEVARRIGSALAEHARGPLLAPPSLGLRNACREPHTVGEDRLFAARGALGEVGAPAVVVDAGTALTVDALVWDEETGEGVFLGGAIAPGPELLARALASGGARLVAVEPDPDAPALGRDTRAALRAGVAVGFAGAAQLLVRELAAEAHMGDAPVVLAGGASAFLERAGLFGSRRVVVAPDLVHRGLLAAGTAAGNDGAWTVGSPG